VLDASAWRGQPVTRIEELLMLGRVPGVQVTRTAGGYEVRVRGAASFVGRADPLYVVDGLPLMSGTVGGINPADVARIEVLKDAADLAAYGMSAANGVIRITTRRPGSR
jgi:TonB-dependent SusC/RagA subfamily outer membrane receptor